MNKITKKQNKKGKGKEKKMVVLLLIGSYPKWNIILFLKATKKYKIWMHFTVF